MKNRLEQGLKEIPVPVPAEAERRGLQMVEAAYAGREAQQPRGGESGRPALPRLALALVLATLLAALVLSPAGAAVRDWVGDVVNDHPPQPEAGLSEIPGGGHLLVQSAIGPWVVRPDGSRRLLGDYEEASWSPRGLFLAATHGRTLSAVEPDGTPHWSLTAAARVRTPRWSPSGYRIAYRSGRSLRIVAGDGSGDHLVNPDTAPVAPAWSSFGTSELAYIDAEEQLRIATSEKGAGRSGAPPDMAAAVAGSDLRQIEWGADGRLILEVSPAGLHLQGMRLNKLEGRSEFRGRRALKAPAGATVVDAALAPRRSLVAAVFTRWHSAGTRSTVVVYGPKGSRPRRLLSVPGSLGEVAWSPDGKRLLVAWPGANQWLFLPVGPGEGRAVAGVSRAFAPGGRKASFPRIEGWCCPGP